MTVKWRTNPDEQMLRDTVKRIGNDFGPSYFLAKARKHEHTAELWQTAADAGLVGVNLPEEHGGGGMGITELAVVAEEFAASGSPLMMIVVSSAICGSVIARFGDAEQRTAWLPAMSAGESIFAFAITEPDAGSNSHALSTHARRDGDGWVLRGQKYYITGVDVADRILVVARTGTDEDGHGQLSLFVVDTDAPGLRKEPIPVALTLPERQYTLYFDDVRLDDDRLIGEAGDGLRQVFTGLNPERILGAALANGVSRYALDRAAEYANQREVWGVPIGSHQGLAHPLAEAFVQVELARQMTSVAAREYDEGENAAMASNVAKLAAADAAMLSVDRAMQAHGGNGFAEEYGIAEFWSLARFLKTAPVSREMVLNFVAERGLGLPRSY
ncbi:Butyryl-CoA dehydrogenase [Euzebya pacifica]|uniref:Butyryl-CoA dehydrogenase n=1 Tax=Euzebya pacifica TaxID=1608957 RepID=A0A346XWX8_9ACTN|nr:Butyryl-CoA dehydrogenase [Euzebya pacifica]